MKVAISSLLLAALLAGCVTTPQTRNEFKTTMSEHPSLSVASTHTVDRRFEDVVSSLQSKWAQCYSLDVTTRRTEGGAVASRYTDTFHPSSVKVNPSLVQMTVQMTTRGMTTLNKVPEGGEYIVALDVERAPKNKTKLSWYSRRGSWKEQWEVNKQWGEGKDLPCLR